MNVALARQQVAARHDWDLLVEELARTLARRLGFRVSRHRRPWQQDLNNGVVPLARLVPHRQQYRGPKLPPAPRGRSYELSVLNGLSALRGVQDGTASSARLQA